MRIYCAAKFENKEQVRILMALLRHEDHAIAHDWTQDDDAGMVGTAAIQYRTECAARDFAAVLRADVLILLPHDRSKGAFVEFGVALASGKRIIGVRRPTDHDCIFYYHPRVEWVDTMAAALDLLRKKTA